jgi:hypothetical protein
MSNRYPSDTIEQVRAHLEAWKNIDGAPPIGDLAPASLEDELVQAGAIYMGIQKKNRS